MADIIPVVLEGIRYTETVWAMPPELPYAVYHDHIDRRGADLYNGITDHDITVELYARKPVPELEDQIGGSTRSASSTSGRSASGSTRSTFL